MKIPLPFLLICLINISCSNIFNHTISLDSCGQLPKLVSKEWRKYKNPKTDYNYYCNAEFIKLLDTLFQNNSECYLALDKNKIERLFGEPHETYFMQNEEIKFSYGILNEKEIFVYKYDFNYKNKYYTYHGVKQNHKGSIEFVFSSQTEQFIFFNRNRMHF